MNKKYTKKLTKIENEIDSLKVKKNDKVSNNKDNDWEKFWNEYEIDVPTNLCRTTSGWIVEENNYKYYFMFFCIGLLIGTLI